MSKILNSGVGIVVAVIGLATLAYVLGRNSRAPQMLQAFSTSASKVVRAAVDPASTATNGNGAQTFSQPGMGLPSIPNL